MPEKVYLSAYESISAMGNTTEEALENFSKKTRNPIPPKRISYKLDKSYPVFEIPNIESDEKNPSLFFASKAIESALKKAKITEKTIKEKKIGICIGSTVSCLFNEEKCYREYREGKSLECGALTDSIANNSIANHFKERYGLKGPSFTISNACASGTDAIGIGKELVEEGVCDIVIAGGVDEIVRIVYLGFISLLNTSEEKCKPFSKTRSGLNLGEGAGICILESEKSARKRGLSPNTFIAAYATASDAYHTTAPEPSGRGLRNAINNAMKEAKVTKDDIAFVNTHGTGTENNDIVEGKVLADIFSKDIAVTVTKAYTGHTLGAAGAIEAIYSTAFLNDGKIPGAPDYEDYDEECEIKPHKGMMKISKDYTLSTSLAFGGINSVLIIGKDR